jgi:hypothetical protein
MQRAHKSAGCLSGNAATQQGGYGALDGNTRMEKQQA